MTARLILIREAIVFRARGVVKRVQAFLLAWAEAAMVLLVGHV
jgi:hypothetical protein